MDLVYISQKENIQVTRKIMKKMLNVTNNHRNTHYNHGILIPLRTVTRNKGEIIISGKNGNKMELLRLWRTSCIFL